MKRWQRNTRWVIALFAVGFAAFVARELKNGLTADLDWDMWLGPAPLVEPSAHDETRS